MTKLTVGKLLETLTQWVDKGCVTPDTEVRVLQNKKPAVEGHSTGATGMCEGALVTENTNTPVLFISDCHITVPPAQNYRKIIKIALHYDKWDLRFLELARVVSTWSKDPSTQCGAVIIEPKTRKVIGLGYNGFPRGMSDAHEIYADRPMKYSRVVHCEMNAVLNAGESVAGGTLYTWPFMSCDRCAVHMIQAGIKRCVAPILTGDVSSRWEPIVEKSRQYLKEAGVSLDELDLGL